MLKIALICMFLMSLTQGKRLQRAVAADSSHRKMGNATRMLLDKKFDLYRQLGLISSPVNPHIKYKIRKAVMNRKDSEADCKSMGGTLATPSTYDEIDVLDSAMQGREYYHLGAQCKDCTSVKDDKWEWSTGEKLSLQFKKWGNKNGRRYPYDDSKQDAIYLFAYKPHGIFFSMKHEAYFINFNGKGSGHPICQINIA